MFPELSHEQIATVARELGATHVIDTRRDGVTDRIREITGSGVDYVVETSGSQRLYRLAVRLIEDGNAYVDSLNDEEIRRYRGTVTEPGRGAWSLRFAWQDKHPPLILQRVRWRS